MTNSKIACLAVDDEPPALEVLRKFIGSVQSLSLAATCSDAIEAINFLQSNRVDLIFLDIKMPELLGTDLIRSLKNPPKVIFTTAYRKYAVEGFELDAVDYLLKPISFDRFLKAVNKVIEGSKLEPPVIEPIQHQFNSGFVNFRCDRKMVKVVLGDILYIESLKDYIRVVTNSSTIITKQSISSVEELLPKEMFLRIHRSYIVALDKIESYNQELLWIHTKELPISRMYRHEVMEKLK